MNQHVVAITAEDSIVQQPPSRGLHPIRGCFRRSAAGKCTRSGALHPQRGLPTACRGRSTPATGAKPPPGANSGVIRPRSGCRQAAGAFWRAVGGSSGQRPIPARQPRRCAAAADPGNPHHLRARPMPRDRSSGVAQPAARATSRLGLPAGFRRALNAPGMARDAGDRRARRPTIGNRAESRRSRVPMPCRTHCAYWLKSRLRDSRSAK